MSKQLAESFFPVVLNFVRSIIPGIYDEILFPDEIASLCPESTITFSGEKIDFVVRSPVLFLSAVLGMIIGFDGYRRYAVKDPNDIDNVWASAFLNFAMMNVAGILVHCLLPSFDVLFVEFYPFLWVADCYFTGVSSTLLLGAALGSYQPIKWFYLPKWKPRTWIVVSNGLGLTLIGVFLLLTKLNSPIRTLPIELWYLLPAVLSAEALLPLMLINEKTISRGAVLFYVAIVLFLVCLNLDAVLCRLTRGVLLDTLTVTSMAFIASDIIFIGLGMWLRVKKKTSANKKKSR